MTSNNEETNNFSWRKSIKKLLNKVPDTEQLNNSNSNKVSSSSSNQMSILLYLPMV